MVADIAAEQLTQARQMSERGHGRRVLTMAGGTAVSRGTGLIRVLVLAWVLGFAPLADAYNLANTVPNMLFDLVLGGVLSATFIPVFVERLALDGERRAWRSISSVVSAAIVLLVCASAVAWICAPLIIDGFTFLPHGSTVASQAILSKERATATLFLRWFVPQIFFYGVIGISTALLNIRHKFAAGAWAPVVNNVICVVILIWFHLVDPFPALNRTGQGPHLVWLAVGTTLGVAVQLLVMFPSLAQSDLGRLRFRIDMKDPAVRAVGRLGTWTLGVVVTNQLSLYVVLALAFATGGHGPVSAYTYGWSFMQMPYAVVVVSVLGVLTPQLAALATAGDFTALGQRLSLGLRQSLVIILPCTVLLVVLAQPIVGILLNHAHATGSLIVGRVLATLAIGLPGFTVFQLGVRGLQSLQRAREVFILYCVENLLTIVLCLLVGRHSITALTGAISLAYSASAILALALLTHHRVAIFPALWSTYVRRSLSASLAMAVVTAAAYATVNWNGGVLLVVRTVGALVAGFGAYGLVVYIGPHRGRPSVGRPG